MKNIKHIKKLGNDLRDAGHMNIFIKHKDEIDFIQIDKHQMNKIKESKYPHELVKLGLADRCFTATSIQEVISFIKSLKK